MAKAALDGYTMLFAPSSHTVNTAIFPNLNFDTQEDFEPIGLVVSLPQILVANPQFSASTGAKMTAPTTAKPGSVAFASVGNGFPGQLPGELQSLRTGLHMNQIPYRGGGPAVTDVMVGQVPPLWVSTPAAAQFVKSGKLKALAVSTVKRSAAYPNVPTMQEAGVADFEVDSWYAMFVPAKTPPVIIEKLTIALNVVLADPEIRERLLAQEAEGVGGTAARLGQTVAVRCPRDFVANGSILRSITGATRDIGDLELAAAVRATEQPGRGETPYSRPSPAPACGR